jgi:hypothetical protein
MKTCDICHRAERGPNNAGNDNFIAEWAIGFHNISLRDLESTRHADLCRECRDKVQAAVIEAVHDKFDLRLEQI